MQWRRRRQRRGRGHLPPSPCSRCSSSPLESGTRWAQKQIEFVPFPLSSLSRWRLLGTSSLLSLHHYHHHHHNLPALPPPPAGPERVAISRLPARSNRRVKKREGRKEGTLLPSLALRTYAYPSLHPSLTDLLADGVTSLARQGRGDRRNGSAQKRRAEWRNRESRWRRVSDAADLIRCWTRRRAARVRNDPRAIWPASDGARA